MKKVLSLVLVLSIVLGSFGFAFAAPATEAQAGDVLKALGVLQGTNAAGDLNLAGELNRQDMIVLLSRLLGEEDTAKSFGLKPSFTDVTTAFYVPYIAWAEANGYTNGIGGGKFGFGDALTVQQTLTFLMRALGYTPEWNDVPALAVELELVANTNGMNATATRGKMASLTLQALFTPMNGEEVTLGTFLGYEGFELEEEEPVVVELEIVSVTASNLKEVHIAFNTEVDADTVVDANFTLKNKNNVVVDTEAALLEDGQTVVLTVKGAANGLVNQEKYTVEVEKVASVQGLELAKTTVEFNTFDATLPVVEEIVVTGPKHFTIVFSEPIKTVGTVEVTSGNTIIGVNTTRTSGAGTNRINIELFTNLTDGTTYDVSVKDFVDYAGYKNAVRTVALAYAKDNSAPEATITKVEQKYVVVEFNKPVTKLTKAHFYHTFTAWTAKEIYKDASMTQVVGLNDLVSKVWVKFADEATGTGNFPIAEGTTNLMVLSKVGSNEIQDAWGNKLADTQFALSVVADRTIPEVSSITVRTEQQLRVTFNKPVKFTESNVEVLDKDGKAISGVYITTAVVADTENKSFNINLGKDLSGDTIIVNIKNVEDLTLQANKLVSYSETLVVTDKTAPEISSVSFNSSENAIYVFYNEDVNATAVAKANYKLYKGNIFTNFTNAPSFFQGNKIVRIQLTQAETNKILANDFDGVFVMDVEDASGNKMAGMFKSFTNLTAPSVASVRATSTSTVQITFNQFLKQVDMNAFLFAKDGAADASPAGMEITTNASGNTVVTLTLPTGFRYKHDASNFTFGTPTVASDEIQLKATNAGGVIIKNMFDLPIDYANAFVGITPQDKIAPAIVSSGDPSVRHIDTVANSAGIITAITIEYTENLDPAYLSALTYNVQGRTVTGATFDNGTKLVTITLSTTDVLANTAVRPSVTQVLDIYDAVGNKLAASTTALASRDKAAPVVVTAITNQINAGTSRQVIFSEEISTASKAAVETAIDNASTDGTLAFSWSGRTLTVSNTHATDATNFAASTSVTVSVSDLVTPTANTNASAAVVVIP